MAERVQMWEPAAALAGPGIRRAGVPAVVTHAAAAAIGQCLDGLIDNAIKYAGAGSEVVVAAYRLPGGWVRLDVIDNGAGMNDRNRDHAVEAFWRYPTARTMSVRAWDWPLWMPW